MSLKAKIEAVLFLTDKPIRSQAIATIVGADVQLVRQTVLELIHEYEERQGGLEIGQDNGYIIQVKDEYANIVEEFLPVEMSTAHIRTLSAIAIKQPVAQAEIIKIRGAGAYDHIKHLLERELITKKEDGSRSPVLSTTKRFQEYFRLSRDAKSLRQTIKKQESQVSNQLTLDAVGGEGADAAAEAGDQVEADLADQMLDKLLESAIDAADSDDEGGREPERESGQEPEQASGREDEDEDEEGGSGGGGSVGLSSVDGAAIS